MIEWQFYPKRDQAPELLRKVANAFEEEEQAIESERNSLSSNKVLDAVRVKLELLGFEVEDRGKKKAIRVPVLFGMRGKADKSFVVDAFHSKGMTVVEVEAGRAKTNYQFLKDMFEACMMYGVEYLVIAVRRLYRKNKDFKDIAVFLDTLYASGRMTLPLKGIMIIGY